MTLKDNNTKKNIFFIYMTLKDNNRYSLGHVGAKVLPVLALHGGAVASLFVGKIMTVNVPRRTAKQRGCTCKPEGAVVFIIIIIIFESLPM